MLNMYISAKDEEGIAVTTNNVYRQPVSTRLKRKVRWSVYVFLTRRYDCATVPSLCACGLRRSGREATTPQHHQAPCVVHCVSRLPTSTTSFSTTNTHFTFVTMASASTGRDPDLEAQRDLLQPHRASYHLYPLGWGVLTIFGKEPGEDEIRETTNPPSEMDNGPSQLPADLAHPVDSGSHAIGVASILPRAPSRPSATCHTNTFMNSRRARYKSWDEHPSP
jgi:hypothetical protein